MPRALLSKEIWTTIPRNRSKFIKLWPLDNSPISLIEWLDDDVSYMSDGMILLCISLQPVMRILSVVAEHVCAYYLLWNNYFIFTATCKLWYYYNIYSRATTRVWPRISNATMVRINIWYLMIPKYFLVLLY